jgi:hypothetical protein
MTPGPPHPDSAGHECGDPWPNESAGRRSSLTLLKGATTASTYDAGSRRNGLTYIRGQQRSAP